MAQGWFFTSSNIKRESSLVLLTILLLSFSYIHFSSGDEPASVSRTESKNRAASTIENERKQYSGHEDQTQGDIKAEIEALSNEISLTNAPSFDLYEARADLLIKIGEYAKSYTDYTTAINVCFEQDRLGTGLLTRKRLPAAIHAGFHEQALKDLEGLIRTDLAREETELYAIMALLLAKSPLPKIRDPRKSLDYANLASKMGTERARVLVERALAAAQSVNGDFEAAVEHQTKAFEEELQLEGRVTDITKKELEAYKKKKESPYEVLMK